jgi:hypothetical protein
MVVMIMMSAGRERTRQATDCSWKGSSVKGYVLARSPFHRGSSRVPDTNTAALNLDSSKLKTWLHYYVVKFTVLWS